MGWGFVPPQSEAEDITPAQLVSTDARVLPTQPPQFSPDELKAMYPYHRSLLERYKAAEAQAAADEMAETNHPSGAPTVARKTPSDDS